MGVAYKEDMIATGFGLHIAIPLMRNAIEAKGTLTKDEAVHLLEECLKVLFYRDARSLNKYEIATITEQGVDVKSDLRLDTNWDVVHYVKGYF